MGREHCSTSECRKDCSWDNLCAGSKPFACSSSLWTKCTVFCFAKHSMAVSHSHTRVQESDRWREDFHWCHDNEYVHGFCEKSHRASLRRAKHGEMGTSHEAA